MKLKLCDVDFEDIRDSSAIVCVCGRKGKKTSHITSTNGGLFCGSCGRQLLSYHYKVIAP